MEGIPFLLVTALNISTWYQFRSYRRTSTLQLRSSRNNLSVEIRKLEHPKFGVYELDYKFFYIPRPPPRWHLLDGIKCPGQIAIFSETKKKNQNSEIFF